jgi:hypothetical protein
MPCGTPINFQWGTFHHLGREHRRIGNRHDLIVIAAHDPSGNIESLVKHGPEIRPTWRWFQITDTANLLLFRNT